MSTVHLRITPEGSRNAAKCNRFGIFAFPTFDLRFRVKKWTARCTRYFTQINMWLYRRSINVSQQTKLSEAQVNLFLSDELRKCKFSCRIVLNDATSNVTCLVFSQGKVHIPGAATLFVKFDSRYAMLVNFTWILRLKGFLKCIQFTKTATLLIYQVCHWRWMWRASDRFISWLWTKQTRVFRSK